MMYGNNWWGGMVEGFPLWGFTLLPLLALWSVFWKGLGLWHSGRRGRYWWFVIMLVVNTAGILDIIFLFAILKLKFADLFSMRTDASSEGPRADGTQ
ncbi:MAG: DUF5652 family protein [bacterium]|nr:DUF5652 family protein [bacterium]